MNDPEALITIIGPLLLSPAFMPYSQWLDMCKAYENEYGLLEKVKALEEEIVGLKDALEKTERQMDKEIRASMRERGDYRGNHDY